MLNLSLSFTPLASLEVGKHWDWNIAGATIHGETIVATWLAMSIIIIIGWLGTRKLERVPSGLQGFLEYGTSFTANIAREQIGAKDYKPYVPLISGIFLFVLAANWLGQIPARLIPLPEAEILTPSNDINTTLGLALIAILAFFFAGFKTAGISFFKFFIMPNPLFLPLKVLEVFARIMSLTFRLFGNILAEELVVAVLILLVPFFVPIPLMVLFLFTSAIQALIFATLTASYIGEAIEEGHHAVEPHHD
ncbi:F0F1 ATP synthase subunit A [Candidatus Cyanaurora vandensis]|uniref:F0F1 ATP synthase subunit A n=1 Tax=Candidatus Cyanaurora vandensis TaxID=2714958 RepID=UPI00257A172E|nr:F0F1 ATP synthase subunit A [Candidatus Cyanaurora vandensis]